MSLHRAAHIPPSAEALVQITKTHRRWRWPLRIGLRPFVPLQYEGAQNIPSSGPVLLLSNHVSFLDAPLMFLGSERPIQFMASQALLQEGWVGRLVAAMGGVPKRKFTSDMRAVKLLRAWGDLGAMVGLFPEGQRSWDGRTLPLIDGIEKLIRFLGVPVITARLHNIDHVWPRWAARPRMGKVLIEFDPPRTFDAKEKPEQIRSWVEQQLAMPPERVRRFPVMGLGLAQGVSNPLLACPRCGTVDGLRERWNKVGCARCGASWRMSSDQRLLGQGDTPSMTLCQAIDEARARVSTTMCADTARLEREGVVLESEPCTLLDVTEDDAKPVTQGQLRLTTTGLEMTGDSGWRLPFEELRATSVEMRRRLQFQTKTQIFEVVLPTESVVKWEWIVPHWQARAVA